MAGAPPALKSIIIWLLTKPVQCFLYCKIYLPIYISCHLLYTWHASYIHVLCVYKFDMLSVFIVTGWKVITLGALHSLQCCKCFDDTSGLPIWRKPILPKNRFPACMTGYTPTSVPITQLSYLSAMRVLTTWQALFQTSNTLTTTENNNQGNKQQLHNMTWSQSQTARWPTKSW